MSDLNKSVEQSIRLQDAANKVMAGEAWTSKGIDWVTCSLVEIGEAFGWLAYKHWKKGVEPNFHQAFIEIVDSYHFMLSLAIEMGVSAEDLSSHAAQYAQINNRLVDEFHAEQDIEKKKALGKFALKELAAHCLDTQRTPKEILYVVSAHLRAAASIGFGEGEFFAGYIPKNTLNLFRQKNGDRQGTYPRMWSFEGATVEDNQVVEFLVKKEPSLAFDSFALDAKLQSILDSMSPASA